MRATRDLYQDDVSSRDRRPRGVTHDSRNGTLRGPGHQHRPITWRTSIMQTMAFVQGRIAAGFNAWTGRNEK
jgi:hypothetical protein